jgi:Ca2+-binding EF-hand superfamily protein
MKRIGKSYTDREIATMIKSVDLDRNGKISLDEFEKLIDSF